MFHFFIKNDYNIYIYYYMSLEIKYTKKELINSIKIDCLKKGLKYDYVNKLSKDELIEILKSNKIAYINYETLKKEIIMTESYNKNRDIIVGNFIKYENIPYSTIKNITPDTTNDELLEIINKHNLHYEENFTNIKEFVYNLYKVYLKFINASAIKNECEYITLPSILKAFKKFQQSP